VKSVLIASVTCVVAGLACMVAPGAAQSPDTDSVAGTATSDCLLVLPGPPGFCGRRLTLSVDVQGGPNGEAPSGTVVIDELGNTPGGSTRTETRATCLSVSGGVAIIGVTGTHSRFGATGFVVPIAGLVRVVDAGGLSSSGDTFEVAVTFGSELDPPLPGPTSCSSFPGPFGTGLFPEFTNRTGDVVVTDARSLPTAKDQCKNNGWRTYGVFKNQGHCVSYVATKGKNPLAGNKKP
jgi:hypothetical protein